MSDFIQTEIGTIHARMLVETSGVLLKVRLTPRSGRRSPPCANHLGYSSDQSSDAPKESAPSTRADPFVLNRSVRCAFNLFSLQKIINTGH